MIYPRFDLYPQDFISSIDCISMTLEEFGFYCWCLYHSWCFGEYPCHLPNNKKTIGLLLRQPEKTIDNLWHIIDKKFTLTDDKMFFYNRRLLDEFTKCCNRSKIYSSNKLGKKKQLIINSKTIAKQAVDAVVDVDAGGIGIGLGIGIKGGAGGKKKSPPPEDSDIRKIIAAYPKSYTHNNETTSTAPATVRSVKAVSELLKTHTADEILAVQALQGNRPLKDPDNYYEALQGTITPWSLSGYPLDAWMAYKGWKAAKSPIQSEVINKLSALSFILQSQKQGKTPKEMEQ
jgi:hypothetical protein